MVRNFPRGTRARSAALLLAGGLLLSGVTPLAHADDDRRSSGTGGKASGDLTNDKRHVERQIQGANHDLDESSSQLRNAAAALQTAQTRLSTAQDHLADTRGQLAAAAALDQQMQAKLVAARARLEQARANLVEGRHKIAQEQDDLGRIVVANYQSGDPSLMGLSMVLTTQDPAELSGQLNSVRNVIDKESVVLDRLEASKALLTVQAHEVATAKAAVARERRGAAANLLRKKGLESQAAAAEASVSTLVDARAEARHQAEDARSADRAQLQNLQTERTRIAGVLKARPDAARARAAAAAAAAAAASRSAGQVLGDEGPVQSNGFLNYPVAGTVTSPFGWRVHPIYGYRSLHDGVDFGAGCGTPIRAAAAGTVVERYFQTAWGNRVIIDHGFQHGVGLATISNHLNAPALVAPGEHVSRGQIVGYVGTTGWSTGCHLHFTVMQNGAPTDPLNWF